MRLGADAAPARRDWPLAVRPEGSAAVLRPAFALVVVVVEHPVRLRAHHHSWQ
jgi:hypothetical protein